MIRSHFSSASIVNTCFAGCDTWEDIYGASGTLFSTSPCTDGYKQSPIPLPAVDPETVSVHAPIYYRNYFNGPKYNKVNKLLRYN